ncbi:MAG: hypothetical protein FWG51_00860 [Firmicutes bacterium]|nr:hypothetical protein [Bacillota bacterium]
MKKTKRLVFLASAFVIAALAIALPLALQNKAAENSDAKDAQIVADAYVTFEKTTFVYNVEGYVLKIIDKSKPFYGVVIADENGNYLAGDMNYNRLINIDDLTAQKAINWDGRLWIPALSLGEHTLLVYSMKHSDFYNKPTSTVVNNQKGLIDTITITITKSYVTFETTTFEYNTEGYDLKIIDKSKPFYGVIIANEEGKYLAGDMFNNGVINDEDLTEQWLINWDGILHLPKLSVGEHTLLVYEMAYSDFFNRPTSFVVKNQRGLMDTITITIKAYVTFETTTFDYNPDGYELKIIDKSKSFPGIIIADENGNCLVGDMNNDNLINDGDFTVQGAPNWNGILHLPALSVGEHTLLVYEMINSDFYNRPASTVVNNQKGLIKAITITINP